MDQRASVNGINVLAESLHALCQPLTAIQCRLEVAQMGSDVSSALPECLEECRRMNEIVAAMRDQLQQAKAMEDF